MNFNFSEEQILLKESIQRWAQDNYSFEQRRLAAANEDGFSREHWQSFAELGWLSVPFSEAHGGYGGSIIDLAAIMEEFGSALVVEPVVANLVLFGGLLERSDNQDLQAQIIPSVIDGSLLGAVALTEDQARYNLADVQTTAKQVNGGYVLNGHKSLVLGGSYADKIIVAARTAGERKDRDGISLFMVDGNADGLTAKPLVLMDGHHAADLELDNVEVAPADLLCSEGQALQLLNAAINQAHVALAAEATGIMQHLNKTTVEYTRTRKQFGVPISSFQALQHRMVDTFMAAEMSRSLLLGTLCELTNSSTSEQDADRLVAALRVMIARKGKQVGDEAIQLHGGMGITDELDVGHYVKRLMMINLLFGNGDHFQRQYNQLAYA